MTISKRHLLSALQSTRVLKNLDENQSYTNIEIKELNVSEKKLEAGKRFNRLKSDSNENNSGETHQHKSDFSLDNSEEHLSETEKKTIKYFCDHKEKLEGGYLVTKQIKIADLSVFTNIKITSLKKALQRLEKKGFLKRKKFKAGKDGWTIYLLNQKSLKVTQKLLE